MPSEVPVADVTLEVNGEEVPLNDFIRQLVANVVLGMVAPLKGVDDPKTVTVRVAK